MTRCECQGERIAGLCIHEWEQRAHGEALLLRRSIDLHDETKRDISEARAEVARLQEGLDLCSLECAEYRDINRELNADLARKLGEGLS